MLSIVWYQKLDVMTRTSRIHSPTHLYTRQTNKASDPNGGVRLAFHVPNVCHCVFVYLYDAVSHILYMTRVHTRQLAALVYYWPFTKKVCCTICTHKPRTAWMATDTHTPPSEIRVCLLYYTGLVWRWQNAHLGIQLSKWVLAEDASACTNYTLKHIRNKYCLSTRIVTSRKELLYSKPVLKMLKRIAYFNQRAKSIYVLTCIKLGNINSDELSDVFRCVFCVTSRYL